MTDMTAEQAINLTNELMARLPLLTDPEAREYLAEIRATIKALTAPRVPDGWRDFVAEVVESAEGYERRSGNKVNGDWVARGRALLTAAQSPADVTLTNEGDIGQVTDSDELAKLRIREDHLEAALTGLLEIVRDSQGVAGYHLNGEVAAWGEFEEVAYAESLVEGGDA